MITEDAFPVEPWQVRETKLNLNLLAQSESLFALSNGHIGLRGNLDEGEPFGLPGTYLNSFYEIRPLPYAEAGYGYPEAGQTPPTGCRPMRRGCRRSSGPRPHRPLPGRTPASAACSAPARSGRRPFPARRRNRRASEWPAIRCWSVGHRGFRTRTARLAPPPRCATWAMPRGCSAGHRPFPAES